MNGAHASDQPGQLDLARFCAEFLDREETLLAAALPMVRALKEAFTERGFDAVAAVLRRYQEFDQLLKELERGRQKFRAGAAALMQVLPREASFARVLTRLPGPAQPTLAASASRIRQLADELAAMNYWISIHLRIHLGAYRRILRDLTQTSPGSGRYGPAGKAEGFDYRPLIHIHG